jgi:anaerobic magnesium-protoporphyrin IX monomethyl ester cyclase
MRKTFLEYPWIRDKVKRNYMLGCLKAFLKSGFQRTFYDLGRVGYWGPQSTKSVDFGFDQARSRDDTLAAADDHTWQTIHFKKLERKAARTALRASSAAARACGGGSEQLPDTGAPGRGAGH